MYQVIKRHGMHFLHRCQILLYALLNPDEMAVIRLEKLFQNCKNIIFCKITDVT
jgi:hypothetical protein